MFNPGPAVRVVGGRHAPERLEIRQFSPHLTGAVRSAAKCWPVRSGRLTRRGFELLAEFFQVGNSITQAQAIASNPVGESLPDPLRPIRITRLAKGKRRLKKRPRRQFLIGKSEYTLKAAGRGGCPPAVEMVNGEQSECFSPRRGVSIPSDGLREKLRVA